MSPKRFAVEIIAILAGAVIGTLAAGLCEWLFAGTPFLTAIATPGEYLLGLVTVAIFAVLYAKLPSTPAVLACLAVGIALPTIVDRFLFDDIFATTTLLLLNFAFALVALSVYRFVHANGPVRAIAADAGRPS